MKTISIDLRDIEVGTRLRMVDAAAADLLVESIREHGLHEPIWVREKNEAGKYQLIAGAHRVAAHRVLSEKRINATVFDVSDLQAQLMEVEENLIRNELNELDRATFLAKHKKLWIELHPEAARGGDRKSDGRKKSKAQVEPLIDHPFTGAFSVDASKRLGWSRATINRSIRRYDGLFPSARHRIAGTWLANNASALDALIGEKGTIRPEDEQHALLDILLAAEGGTRNVAEAVRRLQNLPARDPSEKAQERLAGVWWKAGQDAREGVLRDWLAGPGDRAVAARKLVRRLLAEAEGKG